MTSSGHWVPPGPSKNASRRSSAEKRARTEVMSRAVVLMGRSVAHELGGVWGTGRFPTSSGRRGHAGETWFPPRTRGEAKRCSQDLLTVDDPAMPGPRPQRVRDETAVLRPRHELAEGSGLGHRGDVDLERRLDGDERIEPVLTLRDCAVCVSDALRVEPGAARRIVHAREGAAHEPGEHE